MKMKLHRVLSMLASALLALAALSPASAKTLVLEGSDATTFHGAQAGGDTYTEQLWAFMRQGSALPMIVFGTSPIPHADPGTVFTNDLTGLSAASYSALYIQSPGGCCDQNLAGASAFAAQIGAFYAAGGSVAIQDYQGGNWSFIDPVLATPPAGAVMGYNTGGGGPTCTDNEVFNTEGLSKGFTQPPALGCWEHQAYSMAYFGALGFLSLVDSDPAYFGLDASGKALGSAFLALGGSLGTPGCTDPTGATCNGGGTTVPEPGSLALLGSVLLGMLVTRRKRG
jgi:hypothetical protein